MNLNDIPCISLCSCRLLGPEIRVSSAVAIVCHDTSSVTQGCVSTLPPHFFVASPPQ